MKNYYNFQNLKVLVLVFAALLYAPTLSAKGSSGGGGGGGGGGFTDGAPGGSVGCGLLSLNNANAGVETPCAPLDAQWCPPVGQTDIYEDCKYSTTNGGCKADACTCWGSMENNIWAQFCAPATGTYDFEVSNIACTGGGSSLQFFVAPTPIGGFSSICDLTAEYCNKGSLSNKTHSVSLTSGTCYTLMFDGNAGADCTWSFNINCSVVLGVTMLNYNLEEKDNLVKLKWELTDEVNVKYYSVERSDDGSTWAEMSSFSSKNNPDLRLNYSYVDKNPLPGTSYYRLVQHDLDDKNYYYPIKAINRKSVDLTFYPIPAKEKLVLNFGLDLLKGTKIEVYDIYGKLIIDNELEEKTNTVNLDLQQAKKGMYILYIKSGDEIIQKKFFKE